MVRLLERVLVQRGDVAGAVRDQRVRAAAEGSAAARSLDMIAAFREVKACLPAGHPRPTGPYWHPPNQTLSLDSETCCHSNRALSRSCS